MIPESQDDPGYRNRAEAILNAYGEINFNNFVLYVKDKIEEFIDCSSRNFKNFHCNQVDVHWRPFYLRCAYCDINYDFIGRMESFENDVRYVQHILSVLPTLLTLLTNKIDLTKFFQMGYQYQVRSLTTFWVQWPNPRLCIRKSNTWLYWTPNFH